MTQAFLEFILMLTAVAVISVIGRWIPIPLPITLVIGGLALNLVPYVQGIQLDPEFFFVVFLPPLLFADGWLMPLREFMRVQKQVLSLALGLVGLTMVAVGFTAEALIPSLPLAMALALGAVVSPTDAVAVSAVTANLNLPGRLNAIVNGESLLNDASGLVAFRFALLAMTFGSVSWLSVAGSFAFLSLGGLLLGLAIGFVVGCVRDGLRRFKVADAMNETTLSLMTPFACYFLAELAGVSTVLTVVAAGLYSGWRDPTRMDVEVRRTAWSVWNIWLYWLNGAAFLFLGVTAPNVIQAARDDFSIPQMVLYPFLLTAVLITTRMLWVLAPLLFTRNRNADTRCWGMRWRSAVVAGWSGIRGTVTLAAALSIPLALPSGEPMPGREVVIYLALSCVATTMLLHGLTLGPLIKLLGIEADTSQLEEERQARIQAVQAGLEALEGVERSDVVSAVSREALESLKKEYSNRLHLLGAEGEHKERARDLIHSSRRWQLKALEAEREVVDRLWKEGSINDDVHRPLQIALDHEEAMLRMKG